MKLINDVITQLVDPNIYFSRFSFFESGREAINIKYEKSKRQKNQAKKFFTRSALIQQLIPTPSEGQVRALFGTGKCSSVGGSRLRARQMDEVPEEPQRSMQRQSHQSSDHQLFALQQKAETQHEKVLESMKARSTC